MNITLTTSYDVAGPSTELLRSVHYKFQNFSTLNNILKLFNYFVSTAGVHNKGGGEIDVNKRPFLWPLTLLE